MSDSQPVPATVTPAVPTAAASVPAAPLALAAAPYVVATGTAPTWTKHAVTHQTAENALAAYPDSPRPPVVAVCGADANLDTDYGAFEHSNRHLADRRCHHCAWTIAIGHSQLDQELLTLAPSEVELPFVAYHDSDPLLAYNICEAILAEAMRVDAPFPLDHPQTIAALAHVSAHAPRLLFPDACIHGTCEHRHASGKDISACPPDLTSLACPGCSVIAGPWAGKEVGDYLGQYTVPAPCSVLLTFAETFLEPAATLTVVPR